MDSTSLLTLEVRVFVVTVGVAPHVVFIYYQCVERALGKFFSGSVN